MNPHDFFAPYDDGQALSLLSKLFATLESRADNAALAKAEVQEAQERLSAILNNVAKPPTEVTQNPNTNPNPAEP